MSKILSGQRRITEGTFQKLTTNLNLDLPQISLFQSDTSNEEEVSFNNLQLEYFKVISDWYHYALIELTNLDGFKSSPEWIAEKLGITINQAKAAVDRQSFIGKTCSKCRHRLVIL